MTLLVALLMATMFLVAVGTLLPWLALCAVLGGVGFSFLFAFHYLVWGAWLTRVLRESDEEPQS